MSQYLPNQGAPFSAASTLRTDGSQVQHVQLDIGTTSESLVTAVNPLPVTGSITPVATQYALKLDQASATITYVGEAPTGGNGASAIWRIKRLDETSGLVITWADGNANFDNIWDNRAALTYY